MFCPFSDSSRILRESNYNSSQTTTQQSWQQSGLKREISHAKLLGYHGFNSDDENTPYTDQLSLAIFNRSQEKLQRRRILSWRSNSQQGLTRGVGESMPMTKVRPFRKIATTKPVKVLDAPDIINDFYSQLMDYGKNGMFAIALNDKVYFWNNGKVTSLDFPNRTVRSLKFLSSGRCIAIGFEDKMIEVWDVKKEKKVLNFLNSSSVVTIDAFKGVGLVFGCRNGSLVFRLSGESKTREILCAHEQSVCKVLFSPDGKYLATGGNDNEVSIWDLQNFQRKSNSIRIPNKTYDKHEAAVRAIAWHPKRRYIIATGGGFKDQEIHIWNSMTGELITKNKTDRQVMELVWSDDGKELVAAYGEGNLESEGEEGYPIDVFSFRTVNDIVSLRRIAQLNQHVKRVLAMCKTPDGRQVVTVGAGEQLCFWDIFEKKKPEKTELSSIFSTHYNTIR